MTSRESAQRWVAPGERLVAALRTEIAEARRGDSLDPVTVVVPSFHSAFFLRRAIAADTPLFNVQFLRLEDFAAALIGASDPRPPLSRLCASEIIHAVATDESIRLPDAFARIRGQEGFQRALHRTLDDLDAAGIDPASLDNGGWRFTSAVLGLYGRYKERATSFVAASDSARQAALAVQSGGPEMDRFGRIVLMLVEEPAVQHRDLISSLVMRPSTRVLVGATGEIDSDRLLSQIPGLVTPKERGGETATTVTSGSTRLVSAPDPAEEARWVVRDVLEAAGNDTPFARIAIFFEEPSYGPRLTEAFQLAQIPVSGPSPMTLAQSPKGRWTLGLLSTLNPDGDQSSGQSIESTFARDHLAAWVTGSHVIATDGAPASGAQWDVISRRAGIVSGPKSWDTKLGEHAGRLRTRANRAERQGEDDEARVAAWNAEADESERLRDFVRELAFEAPPDDGNASWSGFVGWLRKLEERYGRAGDDDASEAVGIALDSISDLDSIPGLPAPTFERFTRTLGEELDRPMSRVGGLGSGVLVAPLRQAAASDFDRIYIVGMSEGSYPAIGSEDPLLPDSVRSSVPGLKTLGGERASARRRYLTALASGQKRVLVWPRSQPGAIREVWPSRWFIEAAETAQDGPLPEDLIGDENSPVEVVPSAARLPFDVPAVDRHEYELKSLAAWQHSGRNPEQHFLFKSNGQTLSAGRELEQSRFRSRTLTEWDGAVGPNSGDEAAWVPMSLSGVASPTRLETWANCPFRYFLTYEINVEPTEAPEAAQTLSALDRGIIIHDILDEFVKETLTQAAPSTSTDEERLQRVANEKLDAFQSSGLIGRAVFWRLERERIRRGLLDFLDVHRSRIAERGQRPVATELGFGDGLEVPAVVVQLAGGRSIRFRGWIDRVDAAENGVNATVIDYKSGSGTYYSNIKNDPVDGGRHLQLPIYALAVREWRPETESIDAEFWFVMDEAGSKTVSTSLQTAGPRFEEVLEQIVSGIEEGVFPAYPGEGSSGEYANPNCAYCAFDRICPGGRAWAWERKSGDPAAATFVGLSADPASDAGSTN